jgi:hypothetical protein
MTSLSLNPEVSRPAVTDHCRFLARRDADFEVVAADIGNGAIEGRVQAARAAASTSRARSRSRASRSARTGT